MGFTPEEQKSLRRNFKDEAMVKDVFHEMRTNRKEWIVRLQERKLAKPQESEQIELMIDGATQTVFIYDILETIVLNQIEMRKFLEECIDASIMRNPKQKLKALRVKMEEALT